jgi:hypothetical protein
MDDEFDQDAPAAEEDQNEELGLDSSDEDSEEETVETLRAKLDEANKAKEKAEQAFNDQKKRAEKAESKPKAPKQPVNDQLSQTDLYALIKADVPQEDIGEVAEYARLKGISVSDALKSTVVKAILSDNAEVRKTAQVTSSGTVRRGAGQKSGDSLLAAARAGKMPDSDEDIRSLIEARFEKK